MTTNNIAQPEETKYITDETGYVVESCVGMTASNNADVPFGEITDMYPVEDRMVFVIDEDVVLTPYSWQLINTKLDGSFVRLNY